MRESKSFSIKNLLLITLLFAGSFFGPFGGNMVFPMFKALKLEFGIDVLLLGLSVTLFMIPFCITQLFSGILSDVFYGRRVMITLGFLIYGIGAFIASISPSIWIFLLSRCIQGVGAALVIPSIMALVGDLFRREIRGKIMGGMAISTTLGGALGPLFGGFFSDINWRLGFTVLGVMSIAFTLLAPLAIPSISPSSTKFNFLKIVKESFLQPMVLTIGFLGFMLFYVRVGVYTYLADLLSLDPYNLSGGVIGSYFSLAGIGGLIAGFSAGYFTDKIGRLRTMIAGFSMLLIVLSAYVAPMWYQLLPFLLFFTGFSSTHVFTPLNTIAVEINPRYRATIASVYGFMRFLGYALGPMIAYPLYIYLSLNGVVLSAIAVIILSLTLSLAVRKTIS